MSRKTIELPETFLFSIHYDVLYSDINAANHLGADRILPITMETQLRFIRKSGHSQATVFEDAELIMAHAEIAYLAEVSYGEKLLVELGVCDIKDKSFKFVYRISKAPSGQEVARVATTLLFFDYQQRCVVPVPDNFRTQVESY
ncbi:thioesterase family protein [Parahaliea sp. F7430]|uniref:Thioesterase family protein n=1 Tax=Sediminihaliea albiluteola TaxID=2758564 RepID=A0A7W2YK80_9GAMM|nr:thioesterase family protein [Sediminihaliea albiluteola]MBA6413058.1 thioesterase family protein [Sediminihaliea albiluteola]